MLVGWNELIYNAITVKQAIGMDTSIQKMPSGGNLVLDKFPGASGAYSLRQLSSSYTGPVVRVVRSSDTTQQDFTAEEITDGTLATFLGANTGTARTWYDQSGNGNHLVETNALNQAILYNTGTLQLKNGLPTLRFEADDFYDTPFNTFTMDLPQTMILVTSIEVEATNGFSNVTFIVCGNQSGNALGKFEMKNLADTDVINATYRTDAAYASAYSYDSGTNMYLQLALWTTSNITTRVNGNIGTSTAITDSDPATNSLFLSNNNGGTTNGVITVSEWIIYPTDQTSKAGSIESEVNSYYSIY